MKKVLSLVLATILMFSLAGCGSNSEKTSPEPTKPATEGPSDSTPPASPTSDTSKVETYKIGVSIMELTAYTWYQGVVDGCNDWMAANGEKNGVKFEYDFQDSRSDVQTMLTNVENMIAAGSKGVILFPADASSAIPTMKEYTAQGMPFVIGDYRQETKSEEDAVWSTFVGHDMKALGQKAGEAAVTYLKTLNKDNPVCLFITRPTSGQVSADRFNGFKETVLKEFPNAKIIEEGDSGAGNRDSAQTLMENVLQRESHIDVVCGHNDAEVVGAYNAAVAQGRNEIKFIGIAGDKDVLKWISEKNDKWLGEVLQDPVVLGYQAADAMYKALVKKEKLPADYELPEPEIITPDNIDQYDWASWKWLG